MANQTEYVYHSGNIVFTSLAFRKGERFIAFNFLQGYDEHADATVKSMKRSHPVRKKIYERHRRRL